MSGKTVRATPQAADPSLSELLGKVFTRENLWLYVVVFALLALLCVVTLWLRERARRAQMEAYIRCQLTGPCSRRRPVMTVVDEPEELPLSSIDSDRRLEPEPSATEEEEPQQQQPATVDDATTTTESSPTVTIETEEAESPLTSGFLSGLDLLASAATAVEDGEPAAPASSPASPSPPAVVVRATRRRGRPRKTAAVSS